MFKSKKEFVFIILTAIFITNAIVAELIGGKLIQIGPFIMSIGIIPWPIVFLTTDLINEYYGKSGVKKLSIIKIILIKRTGKCILETTHDCISWLTKRLIRRAISRCKI